MHPAPAKHTLLVVDGDPKSLRVLDVSLKKAGFQVVTALNGREALDALAAEKLDLVIADTQIAEMDGFELCRRIKQQPEWSKTPVILLSSRKSIEDKIRALELGVEDYLSKPVYIKEITTRVKMLLQRQQRDRLESRREGRSRFSGQLADLSIVDLVQTIEMNRKSGIVHVVSRDRRRGALYFREGRVVDAEVGRLSGAEAVFRLFALVDGDFEVEFKAIRRKDVIDMAPQALLMEGMRRLDEWTHVLEALPPLETVFEVDYHLLAERLADIPDEVNGTLRLFDGRRTFQQVIDDGDLADLEAASVVAKLHAERVIYEARRDRAPEPEPAPRPERLEKWLNEGPTPRPEPRTPRPEPLEREAIPMALPHGRDSTRPYPFSPGGVLAYAELPQPVPPPAPAGAHGEGARRVPVPLAPEPHPWNGHVAPSAGDTRPTLRTTAIVEGEAAADHSKEILRRPTEEISFVDDPRRLKRHRALLVVTSLALLVVVGFGVWQGNRPSAPARSNAPKSPRLVEVPSVPASPAAAPVVSKPLPSSAAAPVASEPASPSAADPVVSGPASPPAAAAGEAAIARPEPAAPLAPAPTKAPPEAAKAGVAQARAACRQAHDAERYAAARAACKKALDLNPKLPDAMVMLADVALAEGKNAEALRWARAALAQDQSLPEAYVVVGTVEQLASNRDEAKAAFERYLQLAPDGKYANDVRAILGARP